MGIHSYVLDRLPAQLQIEYGPAALLGRFFLKADEAARRRGVFLTLAPVEALASTNRANRETWRPLLPLFDSTLGGITDDRGLCILGRNAQGEIVAAQGARLYEWPNTNFRDEAESLRLVYSDVEANKRPNERCVVTAPTARNITGRVVFSGAGWYRPDFRGKNLSAILPRISRALAFTRWRTDYTVSIMADAVIRGGMAMRCGYTEVERAVELIDSPVGTVSCHFVWMGQHQLLHDLSKFLSSFDAEIDVRIDDRGADQPRTRRVATKR